MDSEFFSVPAVGGFLARRDEPHGLFDLPFTSVGWDIAVGGAMIALGLGAFLIWRNRPRWWEREVSTAIGLSSMFALIAGAILVFGVHAHQTRFQSESPFPSTTDPILMGQAIFERNCEPCHGQTGEGDGPGAAGLEFPPPRLGDHVPFHNDGTLFLWISEGIPVDQAQKYMPSFKDRLSEEERWHLVNFLRKTFGSGRFVPVLPATATPQGG